MQTFDNAFISYGRADSKAFAIRLNQRLMAEGLKVWFDSENIPLGVDYQRQIDRGIETAHNFLFIISPHAVNSPYCRLEIELAVRYNKRIIPLLHVDQISRDIWQQRNPQGTDQQWDDYVAAGLNSIFPNMHPEISRINWVYFRDGVDDFEAALAGLLEVVHRQQDYVHQHTYFLDRALEWERQQKRSPYLLTGSDRQQAEAWLRLRFKDEQPPCIPTDLHCEYITESIKNANNLMTQVFLSYAEVDREVVDKIRKRLMREGFTLWLNTTDIQTGVDFQAAINRGIEEADTVIHLLSPAALQSQYCQQEVDYAVSLHKRIIPILIKPTDEAQVHPALRGLQYIDLTDNLDEVTYQQDESQLLRILQQDAAYHEEHKILLAKALKWQRQHQNPSLLLRGYNLRHAEAWLKVAAQKPQYGSTALHAEFIGASLQQPPGLAQDVFISYSRSDSGFARQLNDALQSQGKRTWFDQESIASGSDFQQEIYRGIETADNFLFILSPNAVTSPYCADEVEYAAKLNKRFVTVLHRPVNSADLHPELAKVQWIDFHHAQGQPQAQHQGDFSTSLGNLLRTLDTDLEHLHQHTRLLVRALEWDQEGREPGFLMRDRDLETAERWLQQSDGKNPAPTHLQSQYIAASQHLRQETQALAASYQRAEQQLKQAMVYQKPKLRSVVLSSLGVTALVLVTRFLSLLQPLELNVYDRLMRIKPSEAIDKRLLIVEITEADIQAQIGRGEKPTGSLSDPSLSRLLENLTALQPRLIGLDVYRDSKAESPQLAAQLQQNDRIFAPCKVSDATDTQNKLAVPPPPEVPPQRVGFSDVIQDPDGAVRQQLLLLGQVPGSECTAEYALSLRLAQRYLELEPGQGSTYQTPLPATAELDNQPFYLGNTLFKRVQLFYGGYQAIDAKGYKVLLNYRSTNGSGQASFERKTLEQVLNSQVTAADVKDRIVMVGVTAPSENDYFPTPFGTGDANLPGVVVQAQMVSQLLSATLDGRSLIWVWSQGVEALWILTWSVVGGLLAWQLRQRLHLALALGAAVGGLSIICIVLFTQLAGWVPLVPPAIALLGTSGLLSYLAFRRPSLSLTSPTLNPETVSVSSKSTPL